MKTLREHFVTLSPGQRLYNLDKPLIALTGGIASGKSTVTKILLARGYKIIDADQLVKAIYQKTETKEFIKKDFPHAWIDNDIHFPKLRAIFFKDQKNKEKIESFIYARLPSAFKEAALKITGQQFYIYDVPLLFEKKLAPKVDVKLVVYAPRKIQLARLMDRDSSKEDIARKILDQQMDIEEKKEQADFIINNSGSLVELEAEIDQVLNQLF